MIETRHISYQKAQYRSTDRFSMAANIVFSHCVNRGHRDRSHYNGGLCLYFLVSRKPMDICHAWCIFVTYLCIFSLKIWLIHTAVTWVKRNNGYKPATQSRVTRKAQGLARPHHTTAANQSHSLRRTIHPKRFVEIKNKVQFGPFQQVSKCMRMSMRGSMLGDGAAFREETILHWPPMFHYISLGWLNFYRFSWSF